MHLPYTVADGPNPKLDSPWRGSFTVCSKLSPVVYRVARDGELAETTVHLSRLKVYHIDTSSSVPYVTALDEFFLGATLPLPDLDGYVLTVHIGPHTIEATYRKSQVCAW